MKEDKFYPIEWVSNVGDCINNIRIFKEGYPKIPNNKFYDILMSDGNIIEKCELKVRTENYSQGYSNDFPYFIKGSYYQLDYKDTKYIKLRINKEYEKEKEVMTKDIKEKIKNKKKEEEDLTKKQNDISKKKVALQEELEELKDKIKNL